MCLIPNHPAAVFKENPGAAIRNKDVTCLKHLPAAFADVVDLEFCLAVYRQQLFVASVHYLQAALRAEVPGNFKHLPGRITRDVP
jgi:hypothetical protein